jgi:aspartate dehydrogenase
MLRTRGKFKLGIIGCGAIGSRIALSTMKELKTHFMVRALYDIDSGRAVGLSKRLKAGRIVKHSIDDVFASSDIVVECVNTDASADIARKALRSKKDILILSVGRLLEQGSLFSLSEKTGARLIFPSGAIAGLDAIKAARSAGIKSIVLTTSKPPRGFIGNPYVADKGIDLESIPKALVLFQGSVGQAVKAFPQNINVAAALALACGDPSLVKVRIIADPAVSKNTHEIEVKGAFGRLYIKVENEICPDNPKTSYLAVLSAIQTLRQYAESVQIGT